MTPPRKSSQPRLSTFTDTEAPTQPGMERLIAIMSDVLSRIISIETHLDQHDHKFSDQKGAINLVGNIATRALEVAEAGEERWKRMEQTVDGINELAKSTFDIVTGNRINIAVSD